MKSFSTFVKKRRKSVEGVRKMTDSERPNSSDNQNAGSGDQIEEDKKTRKKLKGNSTSDPRSMPVQKSNNIGMVSPMTPTPDNFTGRMVGDEINRG